jgi:copper chaperone CopZ
MRNGKHLGAALGLLVAVAAGPVARAEEPAAAAPVAKTVSLRVEKMACSSCAARVEKVLKGIDGVKTARVELKTGATVEYDAAKVTPQRLVQAVEDEGFHATVARP